MVNGGGEEGLYGVAGGGKRAYLGGGEEGRSFRDEKEQWSRGRIDD